MTDEKLRAANDLRRRIQDAEGVLEMSDSGVASRQALHTLLRDNRGAPGSEKPIEPRPAALQAAADVLRADVSVQLEELRKQYRNL